VLNLTYSPMAVESGKTLTLDYIYIDNASMPRTGYSVTIAYAATANNNVVAAASPTGQINAVVGGGSQAVSVNFTTDDANAATNLQITSDLTALPSGWSSMATSLACGIVSTGGGCQIALTYAPTAASNGTLTLQYSYTDYAGEPKTGALNIPYATTSQTVVAAASPAGQINAVIKTGGQAVPVTFTTDDGRLATKLFLTSDLSALPAGWSSPRPGFSCASVGTGNGCQLPLTYAPAALTRGTLTLNYAYSDSAGTARTGSLNLAYAATTNDNVAGTASPSGQINAVVGMGSQTVSVAVATDDGRPATALLLTSDLASLPSGWSSTAGTFMCSGLSSGNGCRLTLMYMPTAAASGMLPLRFTYKNDAGVSKSGSLNIDFRATTDDQVAGTPSQSAVSLRTGSSASLYVDFATDDGNPASALSVSTGLASLPAGWSAPASFSCSTVSAGTPCRLALSYTPLAPAATAPLTLGFVYANDSGYAKSGNATITYTATPPYLYVANSAATVSSCAVNVIDGSLAACNSAGAAPATSSGIAGVGSFAYVASSAGNLVDRCTLDSAGSLSGCVATGGPWTAPSFIGVNTAATFAYVSQSTGLSVCAVAPSDGALSACAAAGAAFEPLQGIALSGDGSHAYSVQVTSVPGPPATQVNIIEVFSVAPDGSLSNRTDAGAGMPQAGAVLAIQGSTLYVSTPLGLATCSINNVWMLGNCQTTPLGFTPSGIAFNGSTAYLSTNTSAVLICPVNSDGTLGTCASFSVPAGGTVGVTVH
jgi:hypothetical protein